MIAYGGVVNTQRLIQECQVVRRLPRQRSGWPPADGTASLPGVSATCVGRHQRHADVRTGVRGHHCFAGNGTCRYWRMCYVQFVKHYPLACLDFGAVLLYKYLDITQQQFCHLMALIPGQPRRADSSFSCSLSPLLVWSSFIHLLHLLRNIVSSLFSCRFFNSFRVICAHLCMYHNSYTHSSSRRPLCSFVHILSTQCSIARRNMNCY